MNMLRFLLLFLSIPALLYAQQNNPPVNASTPQVASTAVQPATSNPKTPEEFFVRARQLSDLEASGIPFHLKATYVASGDAEFTGNGTYEEWWQSKDVWRKEATLGKYQYIAIKNGGDETTSASSRYVPLRLRQVVDAVLIHIPPNKGSSDNWKLDRQVMSGTDFIMLSNHYQCPSVTAPVTCTTEDFFTSEGLLRVHADNKVIHLFNEVQPFQGLLIPRSITLSFDKKPVLAISVTTLESLAAGDAPGLIDAPVPTDLVSISVPPEARSGQQVTAPKLIRMVRPIYPEYALVERIAGIVVLRVTIDDKGNIREPYVVQAPAGSHFDQAALEAVTQWKYRPLTAGGAHYSVETNVVVVFAVRR